MTSHETPAQQSGAGSHQSHALIQTASDTDLYCKAVEARNAGEHNLSHSQIWKYIRKFRACLTAVSEQSVSDPFLMGLLGYADSTGNTATQRVAADHNDPRIVLGLPRNHTRSQIESAYTRKLRYIATVSQDAANLRRVHSAYRELCKAVAA
jgi:hypothetical protein